MKIKVSENELVELKSDLSGMLTPFIATLLAFAWTMFIDQVLGLIATKFNLPGLAIIVAFIYAMFMTILGIYILVLGKRFLRGVLKNTVELEGKDKKSTKTKKVDEDFE